MFDDIYGYDAKQSAAAVGSDALAEPALTDEVGIGARSRASGTGSGVPPEVWTASVLDPVAGSALRLDGLSPRPLARWTERAPRRWRGALSRHGVGVGGRHRRHQARRLRDGAQRGAVRDAVGRRQGPADADGDRLLPALHPEAAVGVRPRTRALLFEELVAHGSGSGTNWPPASPTSRRRPDEPRPVPHRRHLLGRNGYSLRLHGLDPGFNDSAYERAIVMHGAPYVSEDAIKPQGRLGRSWGCPALRDGVAREVIDTVEGQRAGVRLLPRSEVAGVVEVSRRLRHHARSRPRPACNLPDPRHPV